MRRFADFDAVVEIGQNLGDQCGGGGMEAEADLSNDEGLVISRPFGLSAPRLRAAAARWPNP